MKKSSIFQSANFEFSQTEKVALDIQFHQIPAGAEPLTGAQSQGLGVEQPAGRAGEGGTSSDGGEWKERRTVPATAPTIASAIRMPVTATSAIRIDTAIRKRPSLSPSGAIYFLPRSAPQKDTIRLTQKK